MQQNGFSFSQKTVTCYFDAPFDLLKKICGKEKVVLITDENIYSLHREKFEGFPIIVLPPGEKSKSQVSVNLIIDKLLALEADKNTRLIGVGGGTITDIAGYVASIFKRGILLGLVPTSVLGMVDAAIGGKNGIDTGLYKNMVGTVYQPDFILLDYSFLKTLPVKEWVNGFAEIIKHACIKDELLFSTLEKFSLHDFQYDNSLMASLVEKNVCLKMQVVTADEFEKSSRRILNFGHTFGHAIENLHSLPHGHAISIGMVAACNLSERINHLHFADARRVIQLLTRYHLPVDIETDYDRVFAILKLDKKREDENIQFVFLNRIGEAEVKTISIGFLYENIKSVL